MLKRGFYDLITVIGFVLVIVLSILISKVTSATLQEGELESATHALLTLQLIIIAIVLIYWIFTLILAINLYRKDSLIIFEIVLVAILIPFTPVIYLLLLRKPLKEYHESNPQAKKTLENVPGSP